MGMKLVDLSVVRGSGLHLFDRHVGRHICGSRWLMKTTSHRKCPWCSSTQTNNHLSYRQCGFQYRACSNCKVVFNVSQGKIDYRNYNAPKTNGYASDLSVFFENDDQKKYLVERFQKAAAPPQEKGFSVLEIGCGPGDVLAEIRSVYPRAEVRGVDPSVNNVNAAQSRHGLAIEHCFWGEGSHFGEYDYVLLFGNLMLHSDPRASLQRAAEHVQAGGRLIFDFKNPRSATRSILRFIRPVLPDIGFIRRLYKQAFHGMPYGLSPTAINIVLADAGLKVVRVHGVAGRNFALGRNIGPFVAASGWLDRIVGRPAWTEYVVERPRNGDEP